MAKPVHKPRAAIEVELTRLLRAPLDDQALRSALEKLALEPNFYGLTQLFGPELYRRNKVLFRPFILQRFSIYSGIWMTKWKGATGKALEEWLQVVDRDGDVELFRQLYNWKLDASRDWQSSQKIWQRELVAAYQRAATTAERNKVLAKYDSWRHLDESAAISLYSADPSSASFILRHLPLRWGWLDEKRSLWNGLMSKARERQDDDTWFALYRRQVPLDRWRRDVIELADTISPISTLIDELTRRHPDGWNLDLADGFEELIRRRGRDVFPYVMPRLKSAFRSRRSSRSLIALALENEWLDLWAAAIRGTADRKLFNDEVRKLVESDSLRDGEARNRLVMLTGVSREWNFGGLGFANVTSLEDGVALALYERFPELLTGPFKLHIGLRHDTHYNRLTERAIEVRDEALIDFLASRGAMYTFWRADAPKSVEMLADYFLRLVDTPSEFVKRATAALTQIPAFAIWNYDQLLRENRLARILFERTEELFLEDERATRDLLECPSIHVQALAFRSLGSSDPRAARLAAANVDLLQAALLRPLHRRTRLAAFGALRNAASTPEAARYLVGRIREAFDLPEIRYPREQLVGLLGHVLHRWPELQSERERAVVYGGAA